jgi:sorting nexin-4
MAVQGLGFLESGITEPLNRFSNVLLEFSSLLKTNVRTPELNYQPLLSPSHVTTLPMALPLSPNGLSSSTTSQTDAPFVHNAHSLLAYSQANRAVLRLRDQKQLDFEELSEYMTQVSLERDRLAARAGLGGGVAPATGLGLGAYIRDRVEAIRGNVDDDRSRVDKMKKLDAKIREVR